MSKEVLALRDLGSYHIGGAVAHLQGRPVLALSPVPGSPPITIDPNGSFSVGQMYVQFARLSRPRSPFPLVLWHGGGMTGACWESTPDGRSGWLRFFLSAGLDVLVCDAVERGRASWARFPDIYPSEPFFMPQRSAWMLYRVGPEHGFAQEATSREGFKGGLFPIEAFDTFTKQIVPRWSSNDDLTQAAYNVLLQHEGPCVLVAHSQGGSFALRAAIAAPDKIKALVLVEPGGVPEISPADLEALTGFPVLLLWGDNIDAVPFWTAAKAKSTTLADAVRGVGGDVTVCDLPAQGVHGNSHLLMMDRNSDDVASLVRQWLTNRDLLAAPLTASSGTPPCRP